MKLNQLKLNFVYLLPQTESDSQIQQIDTNYSFSLILDENMFIKDLKKLILTRDYPKAKNITDISYIRLREKKGSCDWSFFEWFVKSLKFFVVTASKAGTILFDEKTIKQSIPHLRDGLEIAIQFLSTPETLQPDDMILELEHWYSSIIDCFLWNSSIQRM